VTSSEQLRRTLAQDFQRPTYHFTSPANWMNDPNGVIQWDGGWHLFYQHNPAAAKFGLIHWGHATSDDLIHWRDLPFALTPTPGSADENGCWSGCLVDNDGVPTIVYTGARGARHETQTQCLATSRDGLLTWEKYGGNPVLSEVPAETGQTNDFRDPYVWREGKTWYLVLASRIVGVGGAALLYRSPDLIHWEYLHPLLVGSAEKTGTVWECPSFFPLGDKWVLIVAGKGGGTPFTVWYFIGEYADQRFTPESEGRLDYANFYAPYVTRDDQNRRLLLGWLTEARSEQAHLAAGWAGAHAIPRVLSLQDGQLHMQPVPELNSLRGERAEFNNIRLAGDDVTLAVEGTTLDIEAELVAVGKVGFKVACSPDGAEQTRITYDPGTGLLSVNREKTSAVDNGSDTSPNEAPHTLAPGESLKLRVLLDGSVLEVIANGRTSICSRIYPSRADSRGVRAFGQGTLTATVWQMQGIWE
jgi:beta-fructofuranosidase